MCFQLLINNIILWLQLLHIYYFLGSNICVAIAATMYCMEEETKIKIYNTFSVYVVAMQQLDNYLDYCKEHTVL